MHKKTLREISKFASGLILGDFLCGLWFYFGGLLPMNFLGIEFNDQKVIAWMIFDAVLFGFLIHYGWKLGDRSRTSTERKFHLAAGVVFTIVAVLHLARVIFGWDFVLGSWNAPYWINGLGAVLTAFLAYLSFELARKK